MSHSSSCNKLIYLMWYLPSFLVNNNMHGLAKNKSFACVWTSQKSNNCDESYLYRKVLKLDSMLRWINVTIKYLLSAKSKFNLMISKHRLSFSHLTEFCIDVKREFWIVENILSASTEPTNPPVKLDKVSKEWQMISFFDNNKT